MQHAGAGGQTVDVDKPRFIYQLLARCPLEGVGPMTSASPLAMGGRCKPAVPAVIVTRYWTWKQIPENEGIRLVGQTLPLLA